MPAVNPSAERATPGRKIGGETGCREVAITDGGAPGNSRCFRALQSSPVYRQEGVYRRKGVELCFLNSFGRRTIALQRNRVPPAHELLDERNECACLGAGEAARRVDRGQIG